ncbi:hypothetical protein M072_4614 [Bacteroides fragilis str. DS-208]|nr:hypothetical protein M072_4614 [Bacteroides fragilis str. DS-208]
MDLSKKIWRKHKKITVYRDQFIIYKRQRGVYKNDHSKKLQIVTDKRKRAALNSILEQ